MKRIILFLAFLMYIGLVYGQSTLGFEFGCVSSEKSKESPTGKLGMVYTQELVDFKITTLSMYTALGINFPHERHPVLKEVQNRIHAGAYTKLGLGLSVIKKRLSIYPYYSYNTKYYNFAKSEMFYKPDDYFGLAFKLSDPKYNSHVIFSFDKRNILIGMTFNL